MYIWNIFAVIGRSPHLLNPIMERIEDNLQQEQAHLGEFFLFTLYSDCVTIHVYLIRNRKPSG